LREVAGALGCNQDQRAAAIGHQAAPPIDIICANSSPAKGRVERANKTLQDRLVKDCDWRVR
jgi:hypothetical protein